MKKIIAIALLPLVTPLFAFAASDSLGWTANFPYTATCDGTEIQAFGRVSFGSPGESLHLYINGTEYPISIGSSANGQTWSVTNGLSYNLSNANAVMLSAGSNKIDLKLLSASSTVRDEYTKTYVVPACVAQDSNPVTTTASNGTTNAPNTTSNTPTNTSTNIVQTTQPASQQTVTGTSNNSNTNSTDNSAEIAQLENLIQLLTKYLNALIAAKLS